MQNVKKCPLKCVSSLLSFIRHERAIALCKRKATCVILKSVIMCFLLNYSFGKDTMVKMATGFSMDSHFLFPSIG